MRKPGAILVLVAALLTLSAAPGHAWSRGWQGHPVRAHHARVIIGFGPAFWWGPYPYWWYYPPAYVYAPPAVVVQEPPVYVQQPPPPAPQAYWYYCPSANGYYPYVQACPEAWIRVPPRPQQ